MTPTRSRRIIPQLLAADHNPPLSSDAHPFARARIVIRAEQDLEQDLDQKTGAAVARPQQRPFLCQNS
jgi:hypothetical protein